MKKTTFTKALSLFLSFVMAFSVTAVALPLLAPEAKAAPSTADYENLATKIDNATVKDSTHYLTQGDECSITDPTGEILAAAEQYWTVFNKLYSQNADQNSSTRTSTQINNVILNNVQGKNTLTEVQNRTILKYFDPGTNVSETTTSTSTLTAVTKKVTVTVLDAVLLYANAQSVPTTVTKKVIYQYYNTDASYESGTGCNKKTYHYLTLSSASRTPETVDTTVIKSLYDVATSEAYAEYLTKDISQLLTLDNDTLNAVKTALTTRYNALINVTTFDGQAAYTKYFGTPGIDVKGTIDRITEALGMITYIEACEYLMDQLDVDIDALDFQGLSDLYTEMDQKFTFYNSATASTKEYLEEHDYIDVAQVTAKIAAVKKARDLYYLVHTLKPRIEADLATYAGYTDDWVVATEGVEGIIAAAEVEIGLVISDLRARSSEAVAEVFGAETEAYISATFDPVDAQFARIREVNGYNLSFKEYQSVYNSVFLPLTLEETSTQLLNILNQRDAWYTELLEFVEEVRAYDETVAEKIFTDAEAAMEDKIDATYSALNIILENEINFAWGLYENLRDETGLQITEANINTYNDLKSSVGMIEVNVYNFLFNSPNFNLTEQAQNRYNELKNIVIALNNYTPSKTLSAYRYNAVQLDPIVRTVSKDEPGNERDYYDVARDRDYTVTDEAYNTLIQSLQNLILDGGLADLGLDFDLVDTLDGIPEKVYTDKFVNSIMDAVYPMLCELVRDMLNEKGGSLIGLAGDLDDAFAKLNVGLAPKKVGSYVPSRYSTIKNLLTNTSGGFMDGDADAGTNCWNSSNARSRLYKVATDENGENILDDDGNVTYELVFDWGIDAAEGLDAKREAFLDAIDAALKALEPLLMGLLCNKKVNDTKIVSISIIWEVASLTMGVYPNDGYNNTLLPIFEAMGVDASALKDAKTYTSVRDVVKYGLVEPVRNLFEQIKERPLEKILELLPNLAFAVQHNLILELLNNLVLNLHVVGSGCADSINDSLDNGMIYVNLGDRGTLDLSDILGIDTFYEDFMTMDGVVDILLGLLNPAEETEEGEEPAPELKLPHIDGAKLAMLGTDVEWNDSFRSKSQIIYEGRSNIHANIIVDQPKVMQGILEYLVRALGDEDFVATLKTMLAKDEEPAAGTEPAEPADPENPDEPAEPPLIDQILENISKNGTDAIAAIFELICPADPKYTSPQKITWITEGNIGAGDYQYWKESNPEQNGTAWSYQDAKFADDNLEDLLDQIVLLVHNMQADEEEKTFGEATDFAGAVDYLLNQKLFTADLANTLLHTVKDLMNGKGELEDGTVDTGLKGMLPDLVTKFRLLEQLGLDITAWDDIEDYAFENGDADAFKAALIEVLSPLNNLLAFILTGEDDIHLSILGLDLTAVSYDGYSYGLVPFLEALGVRTEDGLKTTAEFAADSENIVANIVNPVFSLLDSITADPLEFIRNTLPALIYFDMVGGLPVAIEHLKMSVNVLLDTIRPIYDVNLDSLFTGAVFDLNSVATDPLKYVMSLLSDMIYEATADENGENGVRVFVDFTLDTLKQTIHYTDPIEFNSANGDKAYTITLDPTYGRPELLARIFDYLIEQINYKDEETGADNPAAIGRILSDLLGDDEKVVETVGKIVSNLTDNYTDSVLVIFKLLFPRDPEVPSETNPTDREDMSPVKKIEWITEGTTSTEPFWTTDEVPGKTPWRQADAEYAASHLEELLTGVIKLLADTDTLGGAETIAEAVQNLTGSLFTADNANKIVSAIKDLLGGFDLPDLVVDLGVLQQLGLAEVIVTETPAEDEESEPTVTKTVKWAWDDMDNFNFEDGDTAAFKNALITIAKPLTPILAYLLAGKTLELPVMDALVVKSLGYDGYSYGIVPLLEALGAEGVKTTDEFLADPENIVKNVIDPLFTVVDHLIANPVATLTDLIPAILYFNQVDGIQVALDNILFSINALFRLIQPLYEVDLYDLVKELTAKEGSEGIDLETVNGDFIVEALLGLASEKVTELGITLDLDLALEDLMNDLQFSDPTKFDSANGDDAYTVRMTAEGKARLFATVMDIVIAQIGTEENLASIKAMVAEKLGDNEQVQAAVNEILDNVVGNYTDSVLVLFKLLYPREPEERADMTPVKKINWITEGNIGSEPVDPFWSTESTEGYTKWTKVDATYAESHLDEILDNVVKLLGDKLGGAEDLGDALNYVLANVITAENANKIAEALAGVFEGIALPEEVGEYISLAPLGIDAANWTGLSYSFEDGDTEEFKKALIEILEPLTPILAYLLAGQTLELPVKDALTVKSFGYDGYSYGIVPLLEALGATNIMTTEDFLADPDNIVKNIVDPLFTVVDHLIANPMNTIRKLIPSLIYFNKVDGIGVAIDNILFSVTALIDMIQPLYELDLFERIKDFTAGEDSEGIDLRTVDGEFIVEKLLGVASKAITENTPVTVNLELTLDQLANVLLFTAPKKVTSANGDDAYTVELSAEGRARLLAVVLDIVMETIGKSENKAAIKEAVHEAVTDEQAQAIVDEVIDNAVANYTDSVMALVILMYPRDPAEPSETNPTDREDMSPVKKINWITEGNIGSDEDWMGYADIPEGERTLWTKEKAVYMAEHLGDFLNDIVVIFGEQLGGAETVDQAVEYLVKDIFTAENANKIAKALYDFVDGLNLPEIVADLGVLEQLGLEASNWEGMTFSFADGDRTAFKNALITIIKPLSPVLSFLLAEKQLEVILKDALPIRALGYDGYSYGIVPLLEALGATGLKKTAAFKADTAHIVENIINPLFTIVDHLIANPVKFIEDVIPAILYFDKVEGIQAAVPNLLFAVEALLHVISPLYDKIDIYELVEEKTGIDLTFENEDPIDVVLDLVTDMVEDSTGIKLNLESAAELTEALEFEEPTKFTSANGDDAYTVRLTETGKAALLSRILDYGVNQVIFEDNFDKLSEIFKSLISDDDTRAFAIGILDIMKHADQDYRDLHGIHDVALAELFWIFFGADSVTDAVADFFYRYKDANFFEILYLISDKAPDYIQRIEFLMKEVYAVEYPAALELIENADEYLKPPYEYDEHETQVVSGVLGRILAFFTQLINFFKHLFNK